MRLLHKKVSLSEGDVGEADRGSSDASRILLLASYLLPLDGQGEKQGLFDEKTKSKKI
jgi:hypothetical protein